MKKHQINEEELVSYINSNPALVEALHEIKMLPEEIPSENKKKWEHMQELVDFFKLGYESAH